MSTARKLKMNLALGDYIKTIIQWGHENLVMMSSKTLEKGVILYRESLIQPNYTLGNYPNDKRINF